MPIRVDLTFSEYAAKCGYLGSQLAEFPEEVLDRLDEIFDDVDLVEHPEAHPDNVYCNICQSTSKELVRDFDLEDSSHDAIVALLEYEYTYLGYDDDEDIYYYM